MLLSGQIPFDDLHDFPKDLQRRLKELWIESAEEFVAAVTAAQPDSGSVGSAFGIAPEALEGARANAASRFAPERREALSQPAKARTLGCRLTDQERDAIARTGMLRSPRAPGARPVLAGPALSRTARLVDKMLPVKDQGERGTCVAFATVALREYLKQRKSVLSEQFLYWACKELDGLPGAGTYMHTAMAALNQYGVCLKSSWPYESDQRNDDETHGEPPSGALVQAMDYRLANCRTVECSLIEHYKQVLGGKQPMPVVFATLVFNSWYRSPETHRTGKITMPLPGETPGAGGHAWCVVGYVDDDSVPGGGYLIVRNSWGADWAKDSPEDPGHALMPYEYAERYALEAFTGPEQESAEPQHASPYREKLRSDTREWDFAGNAPLGRRLPAGTPVILNPLNPAAVREDDERGVNWTRFEELDHAWDPATRARAWFPTLDDLPSELKSMLDKARAHRDGFLSVIDENLTEARGTPFPELRPQFLHQCLPWEPRTRSVKEIAGKDLDLKLGAATQRLSHVPEGVPWPEAWQQQSKSLNGMKIYALGAWGACVHVVVAFVTPMHFSRNAPPELAAPNQETVDAVWRIYSEWFARSEARRPRFVFVTLGSSVSWAPELKGLAAGDRWIVLSSPGEDDRWTVNAPPRPTDRLSLTNFLERLKPETRQHRISRIRTFVDDELAVRFEGNIGVKYIMRRTGYRRTAIEDALIAISQRHGHRLYRTEDGDLAISRNTGQLGIPVPVAGSGRRVFWQVFFAVLIVTVPQVIGSAFNWLHKGTPIEVSTLCASVVLAYITSLVVKHLTLLKERE